jgi:type VI secretion system protein ImpF
MAAQRNDSLAPPLMHAFRSAHAARDAKVEVGIRDRGERVLAPRLVTAARPDLRTIAAQAGRRRSRRAPEHDKSQFRRRSVGRAEVKRSVPNFGVPDLARRTLDEGGVFDLGREIETALADFEPRLVRNSIKARHDTSVKSEDLRVRSTLIRPESGSTPAMNSAGRFTGSIRSSALTDIRL